MAREEWHKWKKSLNPSYVIPSKEEDERMQQEEEESDNRREADRLKNDIAEKEAQRQREFQAYYNHT